MATERGASVRDSKTTDGDVGGAAAQSSNSRTGGNSKSTGKITSVRGGYTCCVPGCYTNTKKNRSLSFHQFPKELHTRKKWINAIKRKDFVPSKQHRVCSKHFVDGKRKGWTDVPSVLPLLSQPKPRKAPLLCKPFPPSKRKRICATEPLGKSLPDALVEIQVGISCQA